MLKFRTKCPEVLRRYEIEEKCILKYSVRRRELFDGKGCGETSTYAEVYVLVINQMPYEFRI